MYYTVFNPCPNICKNKDEQGNCKSEFYTNKYYNTPTTQTNHIEIINDETQV